mmetsp:Transcript_20689/g.42354  ORF Transcript_20689/g.42354 Transcript_20689/m.42354 type:complete len:185 (+) Transcript_20689:52-606(+)
MERGVPVVVAEMRLSRLREVAGRALETSLAGCSLEDFCDGFALDMQHRPLLERVYKEAVAEMRGNVLAECDLIFREHGVAESLDRLDKVVAQQPELPDGSRCLQASPLEVDAMLSTAALPVKQKHRQALVRALEQVRQENAGLKQQYITHHTQLTAASAQIDTCLENLQHTAMQCERWSMSAGA